MLETALLRAFKRANCLIKQYWAYKVNFKSVSKNTTKCNKYSNYNNLFKAFNG